MVCSIVRAAGGMVMEATSIEVRHAAILRTVAQRAGNTPEAMGVAEAAVSIWNQLAARLAPIIGWTGVYILFGRTLQLAAKTTPWLSHAVSREPGAAQLDAFRTCVEARDAESAAAASYLVLTIFTDLLASLIGNALTDQLLDPEWTPPPASIQKGNASWEK